MNIFKPRQAVKGGKNALAFIFITVLIDLIGLGLIIPVMPELITSLTSEPLSQAARWGGLIMFTYAGIQFFTAPIIGNLSDRIGRRPITPFCTPNGRANNGHSAMPCSPDGSISTVTALLT